MKGHTMVDVKMLVHVGPHSPGEVIQVSAATAEDLCKVTDVWDGDRLVPTQKAVLLSEWQAAEAAPKDFSQMTQAEADAAGYENKVDSSDAMKPEEAVVLAEDKKAKKGKK